MGGLILLLSSSMTAQTKAQNKKFTPYFQVGLNVGSSIFFGDVKQNQFWPSSFSDVSEWSFAGGINFNYQFTPAIGLRLNGMYGQLSGVRSEWDKFFKSNYYETNINTILNFSNIFGHTRLDRFLNVYGSFGIGITQYDTELKTLSEHTRIKTVGYGYGAGINGRTLQGIMLYGLGLDFRLTDAWNLQIESTNRVMDSDRLDARTSGYALDTYNYTSLGFTYKFGYNKKRLAREEAEEMERIHAFLEQRAEEQAAAELEEVIIPLIISTESLAGVPEVKVLPELEYRVQILAKFEGPLSLKYISTTYLIPMYELNEEIHKGHFIYTVGSFRTYNEARKKRDELRRLFEITDAFVVAFEDGLRIDVLPEVK